MKALFSNRYNNSLSPIHDAENVISNCPQAPEIKSTTLDSAFYFLPEDFVHIPQISKFVSSEAYYFVLFHELIHATLHPSRLSRNLKYEDEELVADLGSMFLCGTVGIAAAEMVAARFPNANPNDITRLQPEAERAARFILFGKEAVTSR